VEPSTVVLSRASSAFSRWLMLGVVAAGIALTAHPVRVKLSGPVAAPALPIVHAVSPSMPVIPSVFQQEAAMSDRQLLDRWNPLVQEAAGRFHVPAEWIRAVMQRESGGRTMLAEGLPIVSDAGAMGIMQVMPDTYSEMAREYGLGSDPFDPRDNVFAAAGYLRWLHGKYGYPAMFAAYNDGPGNFEFHTQDGSLPVETKNYVKAIAGEAGLAAITKPAITNVELTRPDGSKVTVEAAQVTAVRAVLPGEYGPSVQAVVTMGRIRQAVTEDVAAVTQSLRRLGAHV
jgi:soluble lytic murein transglycosylase-like protein